jgi:hypothetical protein
MFAETPIPGVKTQPDWGFNWSDFPVMNMHPHAWPLYSAAKLLGVEFHRSGVEFKPSLPLSTYEFASPLLGFKKTDRGYSGWYAPGSAGRWEIGLLLPESEAAQAREVRVNGSIGSAQRPGAWIRFSGESSPGKPLQWEVS